MRLSTYNAKRNFKITPEPPGKVGATKAGALRYLIQKHAASHLHYDFRLELDGVLLSWAVPKGPSLDPADKRLAMHVEDHPLEYGKFEGTIPQGQYGGGTVMLWDQGTWKPIGDPQTGYKKGHLKFDLYGEKLSGRWALVRTRGSKYGGKAEAWLLIKDRDEAAQRGDAAKIVESAPNSVMSGRSIEEIAAAQDRQWHSNRSVGDNVKAGAIGGRRKIGTQARTPGAKVKTKAPRVAAKASKATKANADSVAQLAGAKRAAMPARLAPALTTLVKAAPAGGEWIHEVKYDGYRMVCRLENGAVRIYSRNGKDWTDKFPALVADVKRLKAKTAWLDGEVCAVDDKGRSNFQTLQNALADSAGAQLVYFVFDIVYLDGYDLRDVPLVERKRMLRSLVDDGGKVIRYSPDVSGAGTEVFRQACTTGLEGMVSKLADSPYGAGLRTRNWVKVKCSLRQEMVIGGFTDPQNSRTGFGALLLGVYDQGELRFSGKVGTGFDDRLLDDLRRKLDKLEQKTPPFANPPRGYAAKGAHWVTPKLVAEIEFTEWSEGGALRHPSFVGLREDKRASEVVREKPAALGETREKPAGGNGTGKKTAGAGEDAAPASKRKPAAVASRARKTEPAENGDTVAGVRLSHPDKLLFPEAKLSKLSLARYYEAVADWILPRIKDRPLSLVRCPDGWNKECFFQKRADRSVHPSVTRVDVPVSEGRATYFAANSLPALVALVQWGVIELHPWGSRVPDPELPDQLIFDFDPADDVSWARITQAAKDLQTLLQKLGLTGFLKTTGGKGLHVVVPIKPTLSWPQAKEFTRSIAEMFVQAFPERYVATVSKAKRKGRIFIDYLRNSEGATAIAAYGIRSRENAPVSTPIAWEELSKDVRFDYFNVKTVPERLRRLRVDPWRDFEAKRREITDAKFKQVGALMSSAGKRAT